MHPNPIFRTTSEDRSIAFLRARAFGALAVNGPDGPLVAHVPILLSEDANTAELHLMRSNPIQRALETPRAATLAVTGPDGYVSPDWYGIADQVPTWNYIAVHLSGTLTRLPEDRMRDMLDRQSAHFETMLAPKPPWTPAKMTPGVMDRMMRMIVPCRLAITAMDSTWKLNQNKPDAARHAAAARMVESGIGSDTAALAALMDSPPPTL